MFRRPAFLLTITLALPGWLALGLSFFVLHRPPVSVTISNRDAPPPDAEQFDHFTSMSRAPARWAM